MKRSLVLLLILGLLAGALVGAADAKKKKKKKAPVKTTLYFHGNEVVGEVESFGLTADAPLPMSAEKPSGAEPKSKQVVNGVVTPNDKCAGNNLFANWSGDVSGKIRGDVKVTVNAVSSPGQVHVRVWPDVVGLMCDSNLSGSKQYPKPAGEAILDLPNGAGEVTAVLKNVKATAVGKLLVQISPVAMETPAGESVMPPSAVRLLYDTPEFDSRIEFMCTPKSGKSCTP